MKVQIPFTAADRGSQGRDEGGGGDCRPIERTTLEQARPHQPGAKEENPQVTIDHPSRRSDVLVAILQCLLVAVSCPAKSC